MYDCLKVYGGYSSVGISPILNGAILAPCKDSAGIFVALSISSALSYGAICCAIFYAFSQNLKLPAIIGGSMAAFCVLFQLCDFAVRKYQKGEDTEGACSGTHFWINHKCCC